jgi:hypothetical protein
MQGFRSSATEYLPTQSCNSVVRNKMRHPIIIIFILLSACNNSVPYSQTKEAVNKDSTPSNTVTVPIKKFDAPVGFQDYSVDTFKGEKSLINYGSNLTARRFKKVITQTYNDSGVMFGGHFSFVRWGCGTSCINGAIVDLRDGKVYDLPGATVDYSFRKDSRLLLVNPPDASGYYEDCGYCEPELWVWNDTRKEFEPYQKK